MWRTWMSLNLHIWFSCCSINGQMRTKNAKVLTLLNLKYDNKPPKVLFYEALQKGPPWKVVSYKGQYNNHDHPHKDQFRFKRGHGTPACAILLKIGVQSVLWVTGTMVQSFVERHWPIIICTRWCHIIRRRWKNTFFMGYIKLKGNK